MNDFRLGLVFGVLTATAASGLLLLVTSRNYRYRGLFLFTISLATGALAACVFFLDPDPPKLELPWELLSNDRRPTQTRATAYTDRGRPIELVTCGEDEGPSDEQRAQEEHVGQLYPFSLIRTSGPDPSSNCHGWVFTGGRYWVNSIDVDAVLEDNGYQKVYEPQPGDLILYRGPQGEVYHTGVVRTAGELVLVEGKWNNLGVYMHTPQQYPFAQAFDYYRSERKGHLLKLPE